MSLEARLTALERAGRAAGPPRYFIVVRYADDGPDGARLVPLAEPPAAVYRVDATGSYAISLDEYAAERRAGRAPPEMDQ